MLLSVVSFIVGLIFGASFVIGYGMMSLNKINKKKKEMLRQIEESQKATQQLTASIKDRLIKAQEMTQRQFELLAELDLPSKNALHSKYKNQITSEVKNIEEDKIAILKSILDDGFDPEIAVMNEFSQKEKIKLSDYIKKVKIGSETPPPPPPPENSGITLKRVGRFFVYSGGGVIKSNASSNSDDPTN